MNYYYYRGDWVSGKVLVAVVYSDLGWNGVRLVPRVAITGVERNSADEQFKKLTGIDPARDPSITMTLELLRF